MISILIFTVGPRHGGEAFRRGARAGQHHTAGAPPKVLARPERLGDGEIHARRWVVERNGTHMKRSQNDPYWEVVVEQYDNVLFL